MQKAFQDREAALLHKERSVGEGLRSLEERTGAVTIREGRVQGLEGLKVQLDADKAALEQRRLQLDSAETEVCHRVNFYHAIEWIFQSWAQLIACLLGQILDLL